MEAIDLDPCSNNREIPDVATFNMLRVEDPKQENPSGFDSSSIGHHHKPV